LRRLAGWLAFAVSLGLIASSRAAEKEEAKPPAIPEIKIVSPFGMIFGETNQVKIRGSNLTNISAVKLTGATNASVQFKPPVKSDPPKGVEAADAGEQLIEATVVLPEANCARDLQHNLVASAGESAPFKILGLPKTGLVAEKEPNGAFNKAQAIKAGDAIQGLVDPSADVDVFSFEAAEGEALEFKVMARQYGSTLDSLLSIFDSDMHLLAQSDDAADRDSTVLFKAKKAGHFFLSIADAGDTGSSLHLYFLQINKSK
jgi:hypothetical protein